MSEKIIIAVAPTGGWGPVRGNPVRPEQIAKDVIACSRAGASVVHLHARDKHGRLTTDLSNFNAAVSMIKSDCDIILEASTGGLSDLSARERALPAKNPNAELGSLNIGSLNFGDEVYRNSLPDVRIWVRLMSEAGVKPSLEIFDTGHLDTALHLIEEGLVQPPCNFSFIFGVKWGMSFHPKLLDLLMDKLPPDSLWGALFVSSQDFEGHVAAAKNGAAFLRTGFEDSLSYDGKTAADNAELVTALAARMRDEGFSIAGPAEARSILLRS